MRKTPGTYQTTAIAGEQVGAFVPKPLPPADPPLVLDERLTGLLNAATAALDRLAIAGDIGGTLRSRGRP